MAIVITSRSLLITIAVATIASIVITITNTINATAIMFGMRVAVHLQCARSGLRGMGSDFDHGGAPARSPTVLGGMPPTAQHQQRT
eukprot:14114003-Alexandrium_andersonii.AAC.1